MDFEEELVVLLNNRIEQFLRKDSVCSSTGSIKFGQMPLSNLKNLITSSEYVLLSLVVYSLRKGI